MSTFFDICKPTLAMRRDPLASSRWGLGFRVKGFDLLQIREHVDLLPSTLETPPKSNRGRLEGPTKIG
jgi:hypothetical protein